MNFYTKNGGKKMKERWDFPVVKRPIREDIMLDDGSMIRPPKDRYIIYNEETHDSYAIVSGRYQLIPHATVIEIARDILGKNANYERSILEKKGARLCIYFSLWRFDASGGEEGDIVEMGIRIMNSYDGLSSLSVELAGERLVCKNGMTTPTRGTYSYHRQHRGRFDKAAFTKALETSINDVAEKITHVRSTFETAFTEIYGRDRVEKLLSNLNLPRTYKELAWEYLTRDEESNGNGGESGFTRWKVYNALTHVISHYNENKSVITRSRYEREVYKILLDLPHGS